MLYLCYHAKVPFQLIDWRKNKGKETDYKTFLDVLALKVKYTYFQ